MSRALFLPRCHFTGPNDESKQTSDLEKLMATSSLHLPRIRPTVGHVRLLLLAADIALWVAIVCAVRHVLS